MILPMNASAVLATQTAQDYPAGPAAVGFIFIGGVAYGLIASRRRWRTLIYIVAAFAACVALAVTWGYFAPQYVEAAGALGADFGALSAAVTGIVHANLTKKWAGEKAGRASGLPNG